MNRRRGSLGGYFIRSLPAHARARAPIVARISGIIAERGYRYLNAMINFTIGWIDRRALGDRK